MLSSLQGYLGYSGSYVFQIGLVDPTKTLISGAEKMIPGQCLSCKHQDLCLLPNTHGNEEHGRVNCNPALDWQRWWIPEALVSQPSQCAPGPSQRPSHKARWTAPEESDPKLIPGLCTQRDAIEQRNTPIHPLTHFVKSRWRSNYHYTKSGLLGLK